MRYTKETRDRIAYFTIIMSVFVGGILYCYFVANDKFAAVSLMGIATIYAGIVQLLNIFFRDRPLYILASGVFVLTFAALYFLFRSS